MEKLAIIKDVNIGVGDYGTPALWFTTYTDNCSAALQVFNWKDAGELITTAGLCFTVVWSVKGNGTSITSPWLKVVIYSILLIIPYPIKSRFRQFSYVFNILFSIS